MAVSPIFAALLAEETARIYEEAELRILERIVALLAAGMNRDAAWWEVEALERLQPLRAQVLAILQEANPEAAVAIVAALDEAYAVGGLQAYREVGTPEVPFANREAVTALARETLTKAAAAAPSILRAVDDGVRGVIAEVLRTTVTSTVIRPTAVQAALNGLVRAGFTRVPVGRGTMSAADYARMAVRTGTTQALLQGHAEAIQRLDLDLVTINPGPRACRICDEWAGRILSVSGGATGIQEVRAEGTQATTVRIRVDASLAEARQAGWAHPNCRCSIRAFVPGITKVSTIRDRPAWDEEGYQAQQTQRGIERTIRRTKELEAAALTPEAQAQARANVRAAQKRMREHLAENPALKRQSAREQVLRAEGEAPKPEPNGKDFRSMSNAERVEAVARMYGTDSPEYRKARKRWP